MSSFKKSLPPISHAGFTVAELIISAAIMTVVITGAFTAFIYGIRVWRNEAIISELHQNLESAMEHIRHDLRLSSVGVGLMAFYPTNAAEYTAFSFPLSSPEGGLLRRDLNTNSPNYGRIIWDQTVIYHVRPGSPDELLRTVFTPRNSNAAPHDFYTQLKKVALSTDFTDVQNAANAGESASSQVVFRNLVKLRVRPPELLFDGYAPAYQRARNLNWGSVVLGSGNNMLTFTVVGKNPDSAGHKIGIDWFSLSASASRREGEIFLPNNTHPAAPYFQHTLNGGSVSAEDMSAYGAGWSGNCQLTYDAGAIGNSITFSVYNDLWCDSQFDAPPGVLASNVTRRYSSKYLLQAPYIPDFVMELDRDQIAWKAEYCANGDPGNISLPTDVSVINVIAGGNPGSIIYNGDSVRLSFQSSTQGQLFIENVQIMQQAAGAVPVPGSAKSVSFEGKSWHKIGANESCWSDWVSFQFNPQNSYLVSFQLKTESTNFANAKTWPSASPMSYTNGVPYYGVIGLSDIKVWSSNAVYLSGIFDTRLANPSYDKLSWTEDTYTYWYSSDVDIRVRSGDQHDLSDACAWEPYSYFQGNYDNYIAGISGGRYVQYEALIRSISPYYPPPKLRDTVITWHGATGLVDLVVGFARGPDYGIVKAEVNGQQFIKGIEVEMEIYKQGIFGTNSVAGVMEVRPLNTGR
ncbi:MAG: PilW family protein [Kiritimatiellia bacterium]